MHDNQNGQSAPAHQGLPHAWWAMMDDVSKVEFKVKRSKDKGSKVKVTWSTRRDGEFNEKNIRINLNKAIEFSTIFY